VVVVRGNAGFWHLLHASGLPLAEQGVMGGGALLRPRTQESRESSKSGRSPFLEVLLYLFPF
jgi:hypothetical protein